MFRLRDMQNNKYWKEFYENSKDELSNRSEFAEYVYKHYLKGFNDNNVLLKIADLGSGNCKDSIFFANKGNYVYAVDLFASKIHQHDWVDLISDDVLSVMRNFKLRTLVDVIYMRWFLNDMPYKEGEDLFISSLQNLKQDGLVFIEVPLTNNEGTLHKNWIYNKVILNRLAKDNNLEILEYTETPLLIRFIVKKILLAYYELSNNYTLYKDIIKLKRSSALKSYEDLDIFNKVIDKYNIKYVAEGGTLLGLHRHGGIIPWDDDIDLGFIPTEWEKLKNIISEFEKAGLKSTMLNKERQCHFGSIDCFLLAEWRGNYEGIFKTYCDIEEYKTSVKQRFGYTYIQAPICSYKSLIKRFGDDYFSIGDVNDGFHYKNDKIERFKLHFNDRSFLPRL
jgi:hypothetical protein